jgi:hypothetical protein
MNWNDRAMRTGFRFLCNAVAFFLVQNSAAQIYTVDWSAFGSGEGSDGGRYQLHGGPTQFGASDLTVTAGKYSLIPGFFSAFALEITSSPRLSMEVQGAVVQLRWPSSAVGFVLEQNSTLSGVWSTVPPPYVENGGEMSVAFPANDQVMFYRLHKP